jgi:hypothetical protein
MTSGWNITGPLSSGPEIQGVPRPDEPEPKMFLAKAPRSPRPPRELNTLNRFEFLCVLGVFARDTLGFLSISVNSLAIRD